jgi:hypothetical protein
VEAGFLVDIGGDDGLAGLDGMALGGFVLQRNADLPDDAGLPADAGAHEEGAAVLLDLHDLGHAGAEGLGNEAAGLGEDLVHVLGLKRQLAEPGERGLLPQQGLMLFRLIGRTTTTQRRSPATQAPNAVRGIALPGELRGAVGGRGAVQKSRSA